MATLTQRTELELAASELLALRDVRGVRLRLVEGSLWLTLDRDTRDVVLAPGDSFVVDRDGVTLLHALAPTRLQVDRTVDAAVPNWLRGRSILHGLRRRLPSALGSPSAAGA